MAQVLIGARFSLVMFFKKIVKNWLTNGKIECLEISAAKQLHYQIFIFLIVIHYEDTPPYPNIWSCDKFNYRDSENLRLKVRF